MVLILVVLEVFCTDKVVISQEKMEGKLLAITTMVVGSSQRW